MSELGFRPLNCHIVVEPLEEVYRGRIILPDNRKKERPTRGIVRAMGPGMLMKSGKRWPMPDCKPGDVVVFMAMGSSEFELEGKKLLGIRDTQVLAVIEGEEAASEEAKGAAA